MRGGVLEIKNIEKRVSLTMKIKRENHRHKNIKDQTK